MHWRELRDLLPQIYGAALEAVDPEEAVRRFVRREGKRLRVAGHSYRLDGFRRIYLVGAGKAGHPMAAALEGLLGEELDGGMVVVKYGHGGPLNKVELLEAGHPEPDEAGLQAALRLLRFLDEQVSARDLLLVVISGGASALLPCPVPQISFADKLETTRILLRCGATIQEMNAIRKHLSRIKGGRLLEHTSGARVVTLLLSDVVGDELSSIGSGPTVADPSTFRDCREIVEKYGLQERLPAPVVSYLSAGGPESETLKPGDPRLRRVQNVVVGSNILGLQAAARQARKLGLRPLILTSSLYGNTADAARFHVAVAREVLSSRQPLPPPCCLISGGETTVQVRGPGKGGRNQEFVLWCAREIAHWNHDGVLFASLGSDGNDGPTDAAGALATCRTVARGEELGMSCGEYLRRNDSYHYFEKLGDLIVTGPTRTNVMDFRFVLIGKGQ